jgi:signal transduction histidine kinase
LLVSGRSELLLAASQHRAASNRYNHSRMVFPAAASPPQQDVLAAVLDVAQRVLGADGFAIWRLHADGGWRIGAFAGISDTFAHATVANDTLPAFHGTEPLVFDSVDDDALTGRRGPYAREGIRSVAAIPLVIAGERTGSLNLYYRSPHRFTAAEIATARALGQTAAAALTAAELYEQLRRDREWSAFLDRASTALAESLDLRTTAQTVADLAVPFFADSCAIHVPGDDGEVRLAAAAHVDPAGREPMLRLAGRRQPNRARGWGRTIVEGTVELFEQIDETAIRQALQNDPELMAAFDQLRFVSQLSVPMHAHGRLVGAISFALMPGPRRFTAADVPRAEEIARRCALAIDNARLYEDAQRRQAEAAMSESRAAFLAEVGAAIASSLEYGETLRTVVRLAVPRIADWCTIDILSSAGTLDRLAVMHADPEKAVLAQTIVERYGDLESPNGPHYVAKTGRPVMISHITDAMLAAAAGDDAERLAMVRTLGLVSYICVPLIGHGRSLGALTFVSSESGRHFTAADLRFAQEVAYRAAVAVENARAYQEVQHANALKDEFLATLSHELRTPLNAVLGYSRMLREQTITADKQPRALAIIERNAAMLGQIVADILDVSRITAGKVRLDTRLVELVPIVHDAVAAILPAAEAKGVAVRAEVDAPGPSVFADADRLQQVVWNLVSNAVKFTPEGGRVEVEVRRGADEAAIVVTDTGVGIAADFLPHVFERFRQADARATREYGGLGLGLAIAKHLVEMHGGTIQAASDGIGKGSTFRVALPAGAARRAAMEAVP